MNKIKTTICNATSDKQITIPDPDGRNIVLYFYPKDSTPGCTIEGNDFSDNHQSFIGSNTVIYGVSRDNMKSHEKFKDKQNFTFELISDTEEVLCKLFDVIKLKKLYGREYMGIDRSTFIINADGDVIESWNNVKVNGHVDEVLSKIQSL
jgi:peroxiredoxin Q/BCP